MGLAVPVPVSSARREEQKPSTPEDAKYWQFLTDWKDREPFMLGLIKYELVASKEHAEALVNRAFLNQFKLCETTSNGDR